MIDFYAEDAMLHAFPPKEEEIPDYVWEKLIRESVKKKRRGRGA